MSTSRQKKLECIRGKQKKCHW